MSDTEKPLRKPPTPEEPANPQPSLDDILDTDIDREPLDAKTPIKDKQAAIVERNAILRMAAMEWLTKKKTR